MNRILFGHLSLGALCAAALLGCQGGNDELADSGDTNAGMEDAVHSKPARPDEAQRTSPGKPSAPIDIEYEIMATPVVGIPLSINVRVASSLDQPIILNYRINDTTGLLFSDAQAQNVSLAPSVDGAFTTEQVTVIPQREGRLYLNVSAQIETEAGMMAKVMAIPIQVGSLRPAPVLNGELTSGDDGEALLSMPAKED